MLPYKTGTVDITTGLPNVVGTGTAFLANVRPGDLLTIDYQHWYPIAQVIDDANLILDINYPDETIEGQSYSISRISSNWGMNSNIEAELVALIDDFQTRLDEDWKGIKGDKGDVAFRICGYYSATHTYVPGDIVSKNSKAWICILLTTGNDPEELASAYWTELRIVQTTSTEGDPT